MLQSIAVPGAGAEFDDTVLSSYVSPPSLLPVPPIFLSVYLPTPVPPPHTPAEAAPNDSEREVHSKVARVLEKAPGILQDLRSYKGAGELIREVRGTVGDWAASSAFGGPICAA